MFAQACSFSCCPWKVLIPNVKLFFSWHGNYWYLLCNIINLPGKNIILLVVAIQINNCFSQALCMALY